MKNTLYFLLVPFLFSCSNESNNNENPIDNGIYIFEKKYISSEYKKNSTDNLKIDITTIIDVELDDDQNFPNGVFLIVNQNFRFRTQQNIYSPGSLSDTLFIFNHSHQNYTLNGYLEYYNPSDYIDTPEVIIHDRNFRFFRP